MQCLKQKLMIHKINFFLFYKTERKKVDIDCGNTAVRLVSSGLYDNSVTVAFDLLEVPHSNSFKCPQKSFAG